MNFRDFVRNRITNQLCSLLPEKVRNKVRMAGTVLFGEGWDYLYAFMPTFSTISQVTQKDIEETYGDLPEESIKVLKDYWEYCKTIFSLNSIVDLNKYPIILPMAQSFPSARAKIEREKAACRDAKKNTCFSYCTPEVFCYHHGLTLVQDKIKEYIKNTCFIDAGAFIGDSAYVFAKYQPDKILSFEPSKKNCKIFASNMKKSKISCFQLVQAGISDVPGEFFIDEELGGGTALTHKGKYSVKAFSIDNYLSNNKEKRIGVIKGDLEGMALNMVRGAIKTIQKDRPVLLIAIYHTKEEFLEVYKYLKANLSDYTFQVASLSTIQEVTLIGYPKL